MELYSGKTGLNACVQSVAADKPVQSTQANQCPPRLDYGLEEMTFK